MKSYLLIVGMLSLSALFFYQSFQNLRAAERPFDLESFTVSFEDKYPTVKWNLHDIQHLASVEVMRSEDGSNWSLIEKINKPSKLAPSFTFTDKVEFNLEAENLYYQLKFVDHESQVEYSEIILVKPVIPHQASVFSASIP